MKMLICLIQFSVCAFRAEIDGNVIEGQIHEKKKAREKYDDAVASGHGIYNQRKLIVPCTLL